MPCYNRVLIETGQQKADETSFANGRVPDIVIREVEYIHTLSERITALIASNERVLRVHSRYIWTLGFFASALRGVCMGFGWAMGTTILVAIFALFLKSFDSVPLVGEFVHRIMQYLRER